MTNSAHFDAHRTLGVMAKHWTAGQVKTRLGSSIGMYRSARMHRLFVQFLTQTLADWPPHDSSHPDSADADCRSSRQLVATPTGQIDAMTQDLPSGWSVIPQTDGDLGNRMAAWFRTVIGPESSAVLIGGDCPLIDGSLIATAFEKLSDHEVVLGPATDGGYYLVGIRGDCPEAITALFDAMTWSHQDVMQLTRQRLDLSEITFAELDPMQDVDTLMDLHALRQEITLRCESTPTQPASTALPIAPARLIELRTTIDSILVSDDSATGT